MIEQLEYRILFAYPLGPEWNPEEDNPPGTLIYSWRAGDPGNRGNASWSRDPNLGISDIDPPTRLTLTNVPAHSEIKVLADMPGLVAWPPEQDPTTDGGYLLLNSFAPVSDFYVEGVGARMNSGLQPGGTDGTGGTENTVTVEIGPHDTEPFEWVAFGDVEVWIWQPNVNVRYPASLNEGEGGNVVVTRLGGDHGIFPIPVKLAKVEVFGPNQASDSDWTLETRVTIPAGPFGTSVNAPIFIVDDFMYEQREAANFRVLPSNIHRAGGTASQPSGNHWFDINLSDLYGGGFQSQGVFSEDLIASWDDDEHAGESVDAVAGDLVGEIIA